MLKCLGFHIKYQNILPNFNKLVSIIRCTTPFSLLFFDTFIMFILYLPLQSQAGIWKLQKIEDSSHLRRRRAKYFRNWEILIHSKTVFASLLNPLYYTQRLKLPNLNYKILNSRLNLPKSKLVQTISSKLRPLN